MKKANDEFMRNFNYYRVFHKRYSHLFSGSYNIDSVWDHFNSRHDGGRRGGSANHLTQQFRMVLPPPNVTGNLHIGHAVTVAIEDAFVRYHELLGKKVVWYPGFDHAGIATQSVVERKLFRETGKYRHDISDSEFLAYCEVWKNDRIKEISNQLLSLGANLSWKETFYTMDKRFSSVVSTAFCRLYDEDLIFRQNRTVNWCPVLRSTVSDQEVELINSKKICSRSGGEIVEVEKEQWFLRCDKLHEDVISALRNAEIKLKPESVEGTLIEWLKYTKPWCLSRQLLWGHPIPAFFDEHTNRWIVSSTKEEAIAKCSQEAKIRQDPDVLDTWFSSSLIPLVVGGWPERPVDGPLLNVMETGHDIIGFWVARMLTLCKRLTNHFPFTNVVLHGMVRDGSGRKMSKSLGNVIDPLDIISGIDSEAMLERLQKANLSPSEIETASADLKTRFPDGIPKFGADALRFAFFRHNLLGFDINLNVLESAEEGRRFCNKLCNAVKYATKIFENAGSDVLPGDYQLRIEDLWLKSRLSFTLNSYHHHMSLFEPHVAFNFLHNFILKDFCDVYLETTKNALWQEDKKRLAEIAVELRTTLEISFRMLSTFMPMISAFLLDNMQLRSDSHLPKTYASISEELHKNMQLALGIISSIRMLRNELSIPKSIQIQAILVYNELDVRQFCEDFGAVISTLSNCEVLPMEINKNDKGCYPCSIDGTSASLNVSFQGDNADKIREILTKQLAAAQNRMETFRQTHGNAARICADRRALNSDKIQVQKEIRKAEAVMRKASSVIHGKMLEIEKFERLISGMIRADDSEKQNSIGTNS